MFELRSNYLILFSEYRVKKLLKIFFGFRFGIMFELTFFRKLMITSLIISRKNNPFSIKLNSVNSIKFCTQKFTSNKQNSFPILKINLRVRKDLSKYSEYYLEIAILFSTKTNYCRKIVT
jgi:hypothetical protein